MEIDRFAPADIPHFLALAEREGWVCDPWEFDFLLDAFPEGCFVARCAKEAVGFVTTIKYRRSGWVGNLLVQEQLRGRGIGSRLMARAMTGLQQAGAETIWLTASADGQPLYEKLGFSVVDTVQRWRGTGADGCSRRRNLSPLEMLNDVDTLGWGDQRDVLIHATRSRGHVLTGMDGFLVIQKNSAGIQFGPWGATDAREAAELFEHARSLLEEHISILADSPAGNTAAAELLSNSGFVVCGRTLLMFWGKRPAYRSSLVYALASMGSMG